MKHWRLIAVCALVAVSTAASHATAQYKAEFKNSLVVGPTGPWGEAAVKFADLLKERTQGRINVVNYFDGQLFAGKQTTEFKLLEQGVADFAMGSTINWSPQVKELNLFSLPFIAFFAACFFYVAPDTGRSWITTGLACVAVGVLGLGFLVTRYGNERMDYFTPAELSAVRYVTGTARPGSLLLAAASSLPWKLEKYEQFDYKTLDASPVWLRLDPEHPDVAALVREVERELKRPTGGYFLLTRSQEAQLEMLGWRRGFLERFEQALRGSQELRIAYANGDASVFVVNPQRRRHRQVSR